MLIKLIRPTEAYAEQVMAFKAALHTANEGFDGCAGLQDVDNFAHWADFENRLKKKYGDGYVPSEVFLAVRESDDKVVGIIDYRHPLSDFLLRYGGNIGYSVHPDERRKGYGAKMLALLLPVCKAYGEEKVLVCCDKINEASRRTIVKNGGVLENEVADDAGLGHSGIVQRWWISV